MQAYSIVQLLQSISSRLGFALTCRCGVSARSIPRSKHWNNVQYTCACNRCWSEIKGIAGAHGAKPVHLIITMIKWIRTSRLSINNSLSLTLYRDPWWGWRCAWRRAPEREFFVDNLLDQIHFIIVMIRWTGLAPWEFEFPILPRWGWRCAWRRAPCTGASRPRSATSSRFIFVY